MTCSFHFGNALICRKVATKALNSNEFTELSGETVKLIAEQDNLGVSEVDLLKALERYAWW